jgi:small subunit ribosomal protein S4
VTLERRLDNIVYRMGLALSRPNARQVIRHGHIQVNGSRVDIPSYQGSRGDIISVAAGSQKNTEIMMAVANASSGQTPAWLMVDHDALKGTVSQLPTREDIGMEIQEQLIVELYSK